MPAVGPSDIRPGALFFVKPHHRGVETNVWKLIKRVATVVWEFIKAIGSIISTPPPPPPLTTEAKARLIEQYEEMITRTTMIMFECHAELIDRGDWAGAAVVTAKYKASLAKIERSLERTKAEPTAERMTVLR